MSPVSSKMETEPTAQSRELKSTPGRLASKRKYYLKNRDAILAKDKETKRWRKYIEAHKEEINAKKRQRYHEQKTLRLAQQSTTTQEPLAAASGLSEVGQ